MHRPRQGKSPPTSSAARSRSPPPSPSQFVLHAKALHGNPFDGHTLKPAIADIENDTGIEVRRIHVDKGYRGHNHSNRFPGWDLTRAFSSEGFQFLGQADIDAASGTLTVGQSLTPEE